MTRSQVVLASLATLASLTLAAPFSPITGVAFGQELPDTSMAQHQFSGVLNADNVYVRSGASENDYPVSKLNKGDGVVIVGIKYDWLKVLPPDNTFCLVGKAWVDKRGDGTVGRVRDDASNVNVRIGSAMNNMISKVALQLKPGDDVKILGEQDEYFKISPPAGTFMYVHRKFVDPLKPVEVVNNNGQLQVKQPEDTGLTASAVRSGTGADANTTNGATPNTTTVQPKIEETRVVEAQTGGADINAFAAATTQPASATPVANAESDFDALEARFTEASKQPIEQQPIDELLTGYKKVVDDKKVPESMLRMAEFRLKGLEIRKAALADFLATQKMREEMAAKTKPLQAEAQELTQRIAQNQIKRYTAVGTLRTSALTHGGRPLYRLTDPATERTVVYVQSSDANFTNLQGLFVGITGEVTDDTIRKIKFVEPKQFETLDPTLIASGKASSAMTPASLTPASVAAQ